MDRVQKILSNSGFCSRRRAEELIKEGKIKVNGKTIKIGALAGIKDKITVDGKVIKQDQKIYLMLNKPANCVTALRDQKYPTVADLIPIKERVFPVGRLDLNTSGLLLMTNDGDFANSVAHPSGEITKTYLVKLSGKITNEQIKKIEQGLYLDDGKTAPAKVKKVKPSVIQITIHEGRNRIVRRMMRKIGFHVTALERIAIGRLELRNLKSGKWRHLKEYEKEKVFQLTSKEQSTKQGEMSLSQAAKVAEKQMQDEEKTFTKKKSTLSKDELLKRKYQTRSTKQRGYKRSPREADGKKPKDLIFPHNKRRTTNAERVRKEKEIIKANENKPVAKRTPLRTKSFESKRKTQRQSTTKPFARSESKSRPTRVKPQSRSSASSSSFQRESRPTRAKPQGRSSASSSSFQRESRPARAKPQGRSSASSPSFQRESRPARRPTTSSFSDSNKRKEKRSKQTNRSQAIAGKKRRSNDDDSRTDANVKSSFASFQQTRKAKNISRRRKPKNGFDKLRKNAKHHG